MGEIHLARLLVRFTLLGYWCGSRCSVIGEVHVARLFVWFTLLGYWCGSRCSVIGEVHVARSLTLCTMFCRRLFVLLSFSCVIMLSVLLRFTDFHSPYGIFKHFLRSHKQSLLSDVYIVYVNVREDRKRKSQKCNPDKLAT